MKHNDYDCDDDCPGWIIFILAEEGGIGTRDCRCNHHAEAA